MKYRNNFIFIVILLMCITQFEKVKGRRKPIRISQKLKNKLPILLLQAVKDKWGKIKDRINSTMSLAELLHQPLHQWLPVLQQEYENRPGMYKQALLNILYYTCSSK